MAYKGSGKKAQIQNSGGRRSDYGKKPQKDAISGVTPSKKQSGSGGNSRKVHDTKGKNTHGRRSW